MFKKILASFLVLCLLFSILEKSVDWPKLLELLINFPKDQLIFLCLISLLISILKAFRFHLLLASIEIHPTFWQTFKVYLAGQLITPLPGGEVIRGILIKKETGASLTKSSGPVIIQAFVELLSAIIILAIGSIFLKEFRIISVILLAIGFLIIFLMIYQKISDKVLNYLCRFRFLEGTITNLFSIKKSLQKSIINPESKTLNKAFLKGMVIGLMTNTLGGVIIYLIADGFGISIEPLKSIILYSGSIALSSFGTIIPAGLGVTEGGMIGILHLFKINLPISLAIVLVFRFITLIFYSFVGFVFLAIFYHRFLIFKK